MHLNQGQDSKNQLAAVLPLPQGVFVLVFFRSDWNPIGFTSLRHLKQKEKKKAHNDLVG